MLFLPFSNDNAKNNGVRNIFAKKHKLSKLKSPPFVVAAVLCMLQFRLDPFPFYIEKKNERTNKVSKTNDAKK